LGTASQILDSGITVAALVAVNSLGSVIDPQGGRPWEIRSELNGEFGSQGKRAVRLPAGEKTISPTNTTLGVIATDAVLTKAQARKISQMAHDGMARAIRPVHTMFDGDTIFCLAVGKRELPDQDGFFSAPKAGSLTDLGAAAADCMTRAIIHAVLEAESLGAMIAFRGLEDL
ncbi:MAG: P1 family peptidase, partial [Pseudomonadota bacterium]